jgi:hypothetical protein
MFLCMEKCFCVDVVEAPHNIYTSTHLEKKFLKKEINPNSDASDVVMSNGGEQ